MYHQFMKLANVDITKVPMEIGPTTHYVMGGIRVDGDTQSSTVPGLYGAGEAAAGLHGANRLGGNSLSDLLVFGQRAGAFAALYAKEHDFGKIDDGQVTEALKFSLLPFEPATGKTEAPYQIQRELQDTMQNLVGIARRENEMVEALAKIAEYKRRAEHVRVDGNRMYNNGWHTALDLRNLLMVSECIARCAIERKESRGGHFRDDYPNKSDEFGKVNIVTAKSNGEMKIRRDPIKEMPPELKQIIEENK
jgi:succinate dehydrogenase / fumarate reductase flavoprotein subunit